MPRKGYCSTFFLFSCTSLYYFRHDPTVNIISGKASAARINRAAGSEGTLCPSAGGLGSGDPLRKFLSSKEHLDWLKIDLDAAKILLFKTICGQNINVNGSTHTVLKLRVEQAKY